jgi:hypothetical protein
MDAKLTEPLRMNEKVDNELPTFASQLAQDDELPVRCGTMLLYAGLIKLDDELLEQSEPDPEIDGPTFI